MILFLLLAVAIAGLNKMRIRPLWKDRSLWPFFAVECAYWMFQACAWNGIYIFIPYSRYLQNAYIISMLFPILRHQLYLRAVLGSAMVLSGTALNKLVMGANAGKMPVYPSLSLITGYFRPDSITASGDALHVLMGNDTALRFLGDYIDVGFSIMSPGDLLIHGFITVIIYGVIIKINAQANGDDLR